MPRTIRGPGGNFAPPLPPVSPGGGGGKFLAESGYAKVSRHLLFSDSRGEDQPQGQAGTEGPDLVETKTVFQLRAGGDPVRCSNILIDISLEIIVGDMKEI